MKPHDDKLTYDFSIEKLNETWENKFDPQLYCSGRVNEKGAIKIMIETRFIL